MKIGGCFLALALARWTSSANAQAVEEEMKPIAFAAVDGNQDGMVSLQEARADADLYENFEMLDRNHDGFLTPAEFDAWPRAARTGASAHDPSTGPGASGGAQHVPTE